MDLKQIEKLMSAMGRAGIKRLALKQEGFELELERAPGRETSEENETNGISTAEFTSPSLFSSSKLLSLSEEERNLSHEHSSKNGKEQGGRYITSPMVGTFYLSPSQKDPAFVKVGDSIEEESVVCIVEAMKVMNEVKAGLRGQIVEVLVKNGEPVEFGTKIFRVN